MQIDWVRKFCLSLPHTTESVQWGEHLVFKIAGKIYAILALEPGDHWLSLKCSDDDYAELIERPGIVPAPYLARAHWVAVETSDARGLRKYNSRFTGRTPTQAETDELARKHGYQDSRLFLAERLANTKWRGDSVWGEVIFDASGTTATYQSNGGQGRLTVKDAPEGLNFIAELTEPTGNKGNVVVRYDLDPET